LTVVDVLVSSLPYLLRGALVTLWLAAIVVTAGTLLGVALGILATLPNRFLRAAITAYIFVLRGTPVLVVMFLGYYAFPALGYRVNAYVAVGVAQVIYVSAFAAEIVRSAILSVPAGQIAAARSLGMRRPAVLAQVILPQATRIAIPPLLNNSLTAVKQTSYASVVGVWELTYAAREVVERTLASFQIFLGVMTIYFAICYPLSLLARWCERRIEVRT
jgi:His/Glu/Gln/Arg/opine family amino acid ABC transporter permease subunit